MHKSVQQPKTLQNYTNSGFMMEPFYNVQKDCFIFIKTLNPPIPIYNQPYFKEQINPLLRHNQYRVAATSNSKPHTNNSKQPTQYIWISKESFEVLQQLNRTHIDDDARPLLNIRIKHTYILDDPFEDLPNKTDPTRSPSPNYKAEGRIEYDEKVLIEEDEEQLLQRLNSIKQRKELLHQRKKIQRVIFLNFGLLKIVGVVRDWKQEFETIATYEEAAKREEKQNKRNLKNNKINKEKKQEGTRNRLARKVKTIEQLMKKRKKEKKREKDKEREKQKQKQEDQKTKRKIIRNKNKKEQFKYIPEEELLKKMYSKFKQKQDKQNLTQLNNQKIQSRQKKRKREKPNQVYPQMIHQIMILHLIVVHNHPRINEILNHTKYHLTYNNLILIYFTYQMGCGGGKPDHKQQPQTHQQPIENLSEPSLPDHIQNPKDKLQHILGQATIEHLEMKRTNYENLIDKLVTQMKIQKKEFLSYNQLLIELYREINQQHNPGKELIELSINFMSQELLQLFKQEELLDQAEMQLQLKTFKFLIDLYLILKKMQPEIQLASYWSNDYMKKYEEKDHQITVQNDNSNTQISNLKQIELQLKSSVQKEIQNIQLRQRKQQLEKISSSKDEVMSKMAQKQSETLVHHAKSQNQKYKPPI